MPKQFPNRPQRARPRLLAAMLGAVLATPSFAQDPAAEPADSLLLSPSGDLLQRLPAQARQREPMFLRADRIDGQADIDVNARGKVDLRRHDVILKADTVHENLVTNDLDAKGDVRVLRDGNLFTGPSLHLNLDTNAGTMPSAGYRFGRTGGHGNATHITFINGEHVTAAHATYSTCTANPLDWVLEASNLDLDYASNTGTASDARVRFKGVTILPMPYASFPLSDARKSGLLPPVIGLDSRNGFEYAQPYYWNIAPNYDATLTPRLLLRRGLMGSAEVRWLQPDYAGSTNLDYIPADRSANDTARWAAVLRQSGSLSPTLSYGLDLQRVSDNNWWQDFADVNPVIAANRTLPQQGQLTWLVPDGNVQASFNRWQTLQSTQSPIAVPYNIQPRIDGAWHSANYTGLQWSLNTEAARFTNSTPGLVSGDRVDLTPSISRPFIAPWGFVTPKFTLDSTTYRTDSPMVGGASSATRTLPTFSLDSGLVYERPTTLLDHAVTQTLEPRLYYVYTPYRDQSTLPNFDSAVLGLNLATIYTDNVFSGRDRIADANNVTAGVTTRYLDATSGAEYARLTVAQRVLLRQQQVTLTGTPVAAGLNDTYALADAALGQHWNANVGVDYNLRARQLVQGSARATWHPEDFKTLGLDYEYQSATATQIPLKYVNASWQWKLSGRWYSVGQATYSLLDRQINAGLLGFEYDGGCWVARVVVQRSSLTTTSASTRLLFQLELSGLSRLGMNPLSALAQNIPGYQLLNQPSSVPSRYANYE